MKKTYTVEELEALLAAHGVKRCELCGEFEGPRKPFAGMGGIDADDMGKDRQGRTAHARCAINKRG